MAEWYPATVAEAATASAALLKLSLHVPPQVAQAFEAPGQYHRVRLDGVENPFAIASAPGREPFQYLVRRSPGVAAAWAELPEGAPLEVSLPGGPGFPLAAARGRPLLLVGTGSGFAPLQSALEAVLAEREAFGPVHALVGVHSADELVWEPDVARWAAHRVWVEPVVSTPDGAWRGRVGHVQDHLEELPVRDAVAFLCGQSAMVADVTRALAARGLRPDHVFLNLPR
jgi:CDP-4-dehydro-6-deoxyglucose reductase